MRTTFLKEMLKTALQVATAKRNWSYWRTIKK